MKCEYCNSDMRLDDSDYRFKGNQDNYWACDNCNASCFEKIRYGKSIRKEFYKEQEWAI